MSRASHRLPTSVRAIALSIAVAHAATPASTADWGTAGGWDIFEGEDWCAAGQTYEGEGETELLLAIGTDGWVALAVGNSNWSIVEGQTYPLSFVLDGVAYSRPSTGTKAAYKKGFTTTFDPEFASAFAAAKSLRIYRGETLVDQLTLSGSSAALPRVRSCVAQVARVRAAEAREKARLAHIPTDPFAGDPKAPSGGAVVGNPDWSRLPDADDLLRYYPDRAKRLEQTGSARIQCTVRANGTVTACRVLSEEPEGFGFGEATIRASGQFQMKPKQADGSPVEGGTVVIPLRWTLP